MSPHEHRWAKLYEDSIIGIGPSLVAYTCVDCKKTIGCHELTPMGIGGTLTDEVNLVGPHGGCGNCSDGSVYKRQIFKDGKLEIIRP